MELCYDHSVLTVASRLPGLVHWDILKQADRRAFWIASVIVSPLSRCVTAALVCSQRLTVFLTSTPSPFQLRIIAADFLRQQNELGLLCDSVFATPPLQPYCFFSERRLPCFVFTSFLYRLPHPLFNIPLLFGFSPSSLSLAFSGSEVGVTAVWPT